MKTTAHGEIKSLHVGTKSDDGGGQGKFTAVVAVFGNVDSYGDRMVKGAFAADIAASGGQFPVVWTHQWGTVPIGVTTRAEETDEGLEVDVDLLIEDHDTARQVYAALKAGALKEFSFGFRIREAEWVTETIDDLEVEIREIRDVQLIEVGPTLIGANSATRLVGVKADDEDFRELIRVGEQLQQDLLAIAKSGLQPHELRALAQQIERKTSDAGNGGQPPQGNTKTEIDIDALADVLAEIPITTTP